MKKEFWNSMVPELTVSNLERSLEFYTGPLGFTVRNQRDNPPFAYLEQETVQIMLEELHNDSWRTGLLEAPLGRGVNFQIELQDINAIHQQLIAAGHSLFEALSEEWYETGDTLSGQREFLVQDPDGYLLRFTEFLGAKPKE